MIKKVQFFSYVLMVGGILLMLTPWVFYGFHVFSSHKATTSVCIGIFTSLLGSALNHWHRAVPRIAGWVDGRILTGAALVLLGSALGERMEHKISANLASAYSIPLLVFGLGLVVAGGWFLWCAVDDWQFYRQFKTAGRPDQQS